MFEKNYLEINLEERVAVIGGLPHPYGGVTVFLRRLLKRDALKIECFTDLYPGREKLIPSNYSGAYRQIRFWLLPIVLHSDKVLSRSKRVFYNFSRPNSLFLFLLLPKKINSEWYLMLHHGQLQSKWPNYIIKYALNKFDIIYSLSDEQFNFYSSFELDTVVRASSYVQACQTDTDTFNIYDNGIEDKNYFISSGYATALYNHKWCIEYFASKPSLVLVVCLYGPMAGRSEIKKLASKHSNIYVAEDLDEQVFNGLLMRSRCYLRPTNADSFGIAVADAISFGVDCIASDVCLRAAGTIIFSANSKSDFFDTLSKYLNSKTTEYLRKSNYSIKEFNLPDM